MIALADLERILSEYDDGREPQMGDEPTDIARREGRDDVCAMIRTLIERESTASRPSYGDLVAALRSARDEIDAARDPAASDMEEFSVSLGDLIERAEA